MTAQEFGTRGLELVPVAAGGSFKWRVTQHMFYWIEHPSNLLWIFATIAPKLASWPPWELEINPGRILLDRISSDQEH